MPLIKETLKINLEKDIKQLEKKLFDALNDEKKGIYHVQEQLDKIISKNIPSKNFDANEYKKKMWKTVSEQWSKSLSEQLIDILSKELSDILATQITNYIKTSTVTTNTGTGTIS